MASIGDLSGQMGNPFPPSLPASVLYSKAFDKHDAKNQKKWKKKVAPKKLERAKEDGMYDAISQQGVMNPIEVYVPESGKPQIVSGHHRTACAKDLDLNVPVNWSGPGYENVTGRPYTAPPGWNNKPVRPRSER